MQITAVLLRWYRSFNVRTMGPNDDPPPEPWNFFREQSFPFIRVPIDARITTIVGANESGKSHLLSAIAKAISGTGLIGTKPDPYEIKDICRYCGFDGLDDTVWPQVGLELRLKPTEIEAFFPEPIEEDRDGDGKVTSDATAPAVAVNGTHETVTVILDGAAVTDFATLYRGGSAERVLSRHEWFDFAAQQLPEVAILDSSLALPNEVHVDELIDLFNDADPQPVVDPLKVQTLWREVESVDVIQEGGGVDAAAVKRVHSIKEKIAKSAHQATPEETRLVKQLFHDVLGVEIDDLERIRKYSGSERGYVERLLAEINSRIDHALDISRFWDQDEEFKLTVNYKSGLFNFEIKDRTGSTYTFNERSSGLKYFLSYYVQAKAMESRRHERGVVILMDEPDSYLSAAGQRSLLRVFDALISKKTAQSPCQLVYTTHSPFLINRNFPTRIRLVRKGDGTEGTQFVQHASTRRFEPVRSALAIDSADTLFLGSTNVILEGASDQKLFTACIQRFGDPSRIEQVLDLNSVVLVSADSGPYVPQFVRKAMKGDERPPVVVVLLDGDKPGTDAAIETSSVLDPKQVCTLRDVEIEGKVFEVLEDLIPDPLIAAAIDAFAKRERLTTDTSFNRTISGSNNAEKIVKFLRGVAPKLQDLRDVEIRAGVVDCLSELISNHDEELPELEVLRSRVEAVCARLNAMIEHAQRNVGRVSLSKLLRQLVDGFAKRFPKGASKSDVRRLLADMQHVLVGRGDDDDSARENVRSLGEILNKETSQNTDYVNIDLWKARLARLQNEPWAKVKDWKSIKLPKPPKPQAELGSGPASAPKPEVSELSSEPQASKKAAPAN